MSSDVDSVAVSLDGRQLRCCWLRITTLANCCNQPAIVLRSYRSQIN